MRAKGADHLLFYQPVVFSILEDWLACVREHPEADARVLLDSSAVISPILHEFLEQAGFAGAWENLKKNNREGTKMSAAFHGWFDAFRTMRLIHELSDKAYPRLAPEKATAPLLERAGLSAPTDVSGQLELLRRLQGAG